VGEHLRHSEALIVCDSLEDSGRALETLRGTHVGPKMALGQKDQTPIVEVFCPHLQVIQ
jgi:hypothetical protein